MALQTRPVLPCYALHYILKIP
uniref:Uncharacterized protein n=1 Tax=Rhizophora mucronata TaxID=61149 RepID=A0A2P2NQZ8_RHIMU